MPGDLRSRPIAVRSELQQLERSYISPGRLQDQGSAPDATRRDRPGSRLETSYVPLPQTIGVTVCILGIRGTVVQTFSRYMRYSSGLNGMLRVRSDLQLQVTLRSVPMVYINSFTQNTEVELVGHMRRTGAVKPPVNKMHFLTLGNVWDFDVINWSDVRSSSSLARSNATSCNAQPTMAFTPPTPPTPRTPQTHEFSFDTPKSSRASAHPQTSVAASAPATNSFTGKKSKMFEFTLEC